MTTAPPGILPVIAIDRTSGKPLYRQLYEGYREAIVEPRLPAGRRLPSTHDRQRVQKALELSARALFDPGSHVSGSKSPAILELGAP